jgi:hypothetical protein
MAKDKSETTAQKIKGMMNDVVGLPPDDKTSHGAGRPLRDPKVPHGGLTSEDPARRDGTFVDRSSPPMNRS